MSYFLIYYTIASLVFAALDLLLARMSYLKKGILGKSLAATCVGCALVDLTYLVSIWSESAIVNACMSSLYFICVDVMLVALLFFLSHFTKRSMSRLGRFGLGFCVVYTLVEIVLFAINPFCDFIISYVPRNTPFAKFAYDMHFGFYVHLFFCYSMVAACVILLLHKMFVVPLEYKRQYLYATLGLFAIVAVNGIFLFMPSLNSYSFVDLSILGYSLGAYVFYWSCFQYSVKGMMDLFKMSVFENLDQGLVLFDYDNKLILHNDMAQKLLPGVDFSERRLMTDFSAQCGVRMGSNYENFVVQCYSEIDGVSKPLRADFRTLKNRRGRVVGRLFMFSNAVLATDPLTGFHNWDDFAFYAEENKNVEREDIVVASCDIMGLSVFNGAHGHHMGDQRIKELSDLFRKNFPVGSYFIRGQDAVLICLCYGKDESRVLEILERIDREFPLHLQYSVSLCGSNSDMLKSIEVSLKGLKQKKLLDRESSHSVILNSLVQALQECDSDTEEHVRRTQLMGAELGKRIGLSDVQQSDLSLLCLLHDIGKIGVPLEILNKPGKLSNEEWNVLRTHPAKGFQIANSSVELSGIADMILHHHERWDGAGYPDGLSRESIPLLSRVIAVVDAYDAMVNNRSYRTALSQEDAVNELKRCSGSQFDPNIVSEFIQMLDELPKQSAAATKSSASEEVKEMIREEISQGEESRNTLSNVHALKFVRYILDDKNYIVSMDKDFERLTGYTKQDVAERRMTQLDLLPEEDRIEYSRQMVEYLGKNPHAFFEHRILRKDGSVIYVLCFGRMYFDSAVRSGRSEIVVADVSDTYSLRVMVDMERSKVRLRQEQWENAYRRDSLTGLLTRAAFKSDTEYKLLEGKSKVMLLMLDVDEFKKYNDTYGHHEGDELLALIGQTLTSTLRRNDIAGRMGGDEFSAALFFDKNCTDEFMYQRAQQIFDKINMSLGSNSKGVGLSMGACIANENLRSFNDLYQTADKHLYVSKTNGKSRLSVNR